MTTVAQEADAALSVVTLVPGATQGTGAASLLQENHGEDTQMLVATSTSSTANTPEVEGRVLLQRLWAHFQMR